MNLRFLRHPDIQSDVWGTLPNPFSSFKMNTSRLASICEKETELALLKCRILVAKPLEDILGADLIGFTTLADRWRLFRIQCKYRSLGRSTHVELPVKYVAGAFVLFLYLVIGDKSHFLCFLPGDIHSHFKKLPNGSQSLLRLTLTKKQALTLVDNKSLHFDSGKQKEIVALTLAESTDAEMRRAFAHVIKLNEVARKAEARANRLRKLSQDVELATHQLESAKQHAEILEEYLAYRESHEHS